MNTQDTHPLEFALGGKPMSQIRAEEDRDPKFEYEVDEIECDNGLFLSGMVWVEVDFEKRQTLTQNYDVGEAFFHFVGSALVGGLGMPRDDFEKMVGSKTLAKIDEALTDEFGG